MESIKPKAQFQITSSEVVARHTALNDPDFLDNVVGQRSRTIKASPTEVGGTAQDGNKLTKKSTKGVFMNKKPHLYGKLEIPIDTKRHKNVVRSRQRRAMKEDLFDTLIGKIYLDLGDMMETWLQNYDPGDGDSEGWTEDEETGDQLVDLDKAADAFYEDPYLEDSIVNEWMYVIGADSESQSFTVGECDVKSVDVGDITVDQDEEKALAPITFHLAKAYPKSEFDKVKQEFYDAVKHPGRAENVSLDITDSKLMNTVPDVPEVGKSRRARKQSAKPKTFTVTTKFTFVFKDDYLQELADKAQEQVYIDASNQLGEDEEADQDSEAFMDAVDETERGFRQSELEDWKMNWRHYFAILDPSEYTIDTDAGDAGWQMIISQNGDLQFPGKLSMPEVECIMKNTVEVRPLSRQNYPSLDAIKEMVDDDIADTLQYMQPKGSEYTIDVQAAQTDYSQVQL